MRLIIDWVTETTLQELALRICALAKFRSRSIVTVAPIPNFVSRASLPGLSVKDRLSSALLSQDLSGKPGNERIHGVSGCPGARGEGAFKPRAKFLVRGVIVR
jgi:hypothetical protein